MQIYCKYLNFYALCEKINRKNKNYGFSPPFELQFALFYGASSSGVTADNETPFAPRFLPTTTIFIPLDIKLVRHFAQCPKFCIFVKSFIYKTTPILRRLRSVATKSPPEEGI